MTYASTSRRRRLATSADPWVVEVVEGWATTAVVACVAEGVTDAPPLAAVVAVPVAAWDAAVAWGDPDAVVDPWVGVAIVVDIRAVAAGDHPGVAECCCSFPALSSFVNPSGKETRADFF